MPQKTATISVPGQDAASIIAIAYGALESLGWDIKYAVEKMIIAYTPKAWNKYDHEINIDATDGQLTITSKHIHGEIADLPGRNKKFIDAFTSAFESVKAATTAEQRDAWKEKITSLQQMTIQVAQEEVKQATEIDSVMNRSKSNLYVTYGIMAINVVVFLLMVISGVSLISPTGLDILKWGGNNSIFTLTGDWWRLVTCMFVHIGIIHIVFNMYALYMIGVYLEPMLGKTRYVAAYLATGLCSSLVSLWWHKEPITSAGASGAIFGMYGVFLALLSTKLIPKQVRDQLLKSIGIFIVYNLVYGMKSGVDNSAHMGGLISGLVVGYIYYAGWKGENVVKKKTVLAVAVLIASMAAAYFYLEGNKGNMEDRKQVEQLLKTINGTNESSADKVKLLEQYGEFSKIETIALEPVTDTSLTEEQLINKLDQVSAPEWNKAANLVTEIKGYDVSEDDRKKINLLETYVNKRKTQLDLLKEYLRSHTPASDSSLRAINLELKSLLIEINSL